ncbi:hypothetical protein BC828DRAFT_393434 [Blastocladiella britannica]|nr:hypothetical protein BC828DRAFT_393434 [Blastocladiella britannica]
MAAIATPTRRILCILDLNGVMLARLNPQEHKLARTAAAAAGRDLPPRAGSVGKRPVFVRPFSTHFTNLLLDGGVPGIDVAVWTSAAPANARKLADLVLGSGDGRSDKFAFVWSRDQCTAVDERGLPWATIKDLRNVYKAFPHHTPATTLIVDDSLSKCRLNPANALLVPSWNLVDPQENEVEDPNLDTTLVDLLAYLKVMQRSAPSDVREYIAARPFANATRVRANGGQGIGPGAPIVTYVANRHPTWEVVAGSEVPKFLSWFWKRVLTSNEC